MYSESAVAEARRRVDDILKAIADIDEFTAGQDFKLFVSDKKAIYAISYCLLDIGEASNHLLAGIELRQPPIPWRQIRATRNRIAHEYRGLDSRVVWDTAVNDLAPLRAAVMAERDWLLTRP